MRGKKANDTEVMFYNLRSQYLFLLTRKLSSEPYRTYQNPERFVPACLFPVAEANFISHHSSNHIGDFAEDGAMTAVQFSSANQLLSSHIIMMS